MLFSSILTPCLYAYAYDYANELLGTWKYFSLICYTNCMNYSMKLVLINLLLDLFYKTISELKMPSHLKYSVAEIFPHINSGIFSKSILLKIY